MAKKTGELVILPPFGPTEKFAFDTYLSNNHKLTAPSPWIPFASTAKGLKWDPTPAFSDDVDIATAVEWLEHHIIPKFIKPLRHMSGKLEIEGKGTIIVNDNMVTSFTLHDEPSFGTKKDGTPKSKPGPKPKSLKEILAAQKSNGQKESDDSSDPNYSPYNTTELDDFKQKVVELEAEIEKLKKPKKSKCPQGKRWVRLTVSKEIDKEKFVEGVKLTIMGVEEIEVFE
jgi:hypothetical protein